MDLSIPLTIPMMLDIELRRVNPMVDCLLAMAMREVGVVRRLFMLIHIIVPRSFLMMVSGFFVQLCGFLMMVCGVF